jgi:drug/metabolite transporter (DMT)-like permease
MAAEKAPGRRWLLFALGALFFFGVTNFFLGFISEKSAADPAASIQAAMILWLGTGLLGIAGAAFFIFSGRGFSGLPGKSSLLLPAAAGLTLALAMLLLKASLAANPLAKGPIVAITSSNSLVVALLAMVFIGEKLSPGQWAGFLAIVAGIVLVSLGGGNNGHFAMVGLAVAAMILFGLTNFFLKLAGERGCDSVSVAVVLWLSVGACGVLAGAWHLLARSRLPELGYPGLGRLALLAGVFLGLGMLCIKKAVTLGLAGPATAVSGSNAILVSLLDLGLLGHWLPPLKLAGMLTVIAGIVTLALSRPSKKDRAGNVRRAMA